MVRLDQIDGSTLGIEPDLAARARADPPELPPQLAEGVPARRLRRCGDLGVLAFPPHLPIVLGAADHRGDLLVGPALGRTPRPPDAEEQRIEVVARVALGARHVPEVGQEDLQQLRGSTLRLGGLGRRGKRTGRKEAHDHAVTC